MAAQLSQFESLFRQFHVPLVRFACKWVREGEAAEELVQDVFMKVWDKRAELSLDESLKSYLFTAVRNRAFNYLRDQSRKGQMDELDDNIDLEAPKGDPLELDDLQRIIQQGIDSLPPRCRAIFLLSREAEMSYKEIAAELEVSVKTVEGQMGIALRKLRNYLTDRNMNWLWLLLIAQQLFNENHLTL
ncbi:MAG: RNA polymerase sigma-70 factor [Bacteroidia bacterium]